jgi:polysaccharide deacetylase 2 family uncharacterized protein YibQ
MSPLTLGVAIFAAVVGGIALGVGVGWLAGMLEPDVPPGTSEVSYPASREASSELEPRPDPRAPRPRLAIKPGVVIETPALPVVPPQATRTPTETASLAATVPAWRRLASRTALQPGVPMIGIVIDDLGLDHPRTARAMRLPAPVTLAFLSYGNRLAEETAAARAAGHELLVHVPMEPQGPAMDPGPNVLRSGDDAAQIRARLDWALGRFTGFVGINNHMGSKFTADAAAMDVVAQELKARGLLFLDSRTSAATRAFERARAAGVPAASRGIFLDRELNPEAVRQSLADLETRARKHGRAIAIGHPHDVTLDSLEAWLPTLAAKGLQLAPVSALVEGGAGAAP